MGKKFVPVELHVVSILVCIAGGIYFIIGIPLLLLLGFGIFPMTLGAALIYYGVGIYRLKRNAYVGTLVLAVLVLLHGLQSMRLWHIATTLVLVSIVYSHRNLFVA